MGVVHGCMGPWGGGGPWVHGVGVVRGSMGVVRGSTGVVHGSMGVLHRGVPWVHGSTDGGPPWVHGYMNRGGTSGPWGWSKPNTVHVLLDIK